MNCPACGQPMNGTIFVCSNCWWKVPPKDRALIRAMRLRKQDTTTKLAQIVRDLKAKAQ